MFSASHLLRIQKHCETMLLTPASGQLSPTAFIMDLATTHDIRIINFTDEQLAAVQENILITDQKLEGVHYQGVDED